MTTPRSGADGAVARGVGKRPQILPFRREELVETPTDEEYSEIIRGHRWLGGESWKLVLRRVTREFFARGMMDKGALLTFFSLLTFAPTVVGAYSIATLLLANDTAATNRLITQLIRDYVPPEAEETATDIVLEIVQQAGDHVWVIVVSILVALFSSSAYVRAFARNANAIYGREEGRHPVRTVLVMWALTFVVVLGAVLLAASLLLNEIVVRDVFEPVAEPLGLDAAVEWLAGAVMPVWRWVRLPVAVLLSMVLIALLYNFTPNVRYPRFRWLSVGTVVAVLGGVLVYAGLTAYLRVFTRMSLLSAVGAVVAFLIALWIYNIVLMVGLSLDAEVARARELEAGLDSEAVIRVPPRGESAARRQRDVGKRLRAAGKAIGPEN
ncbi:YihY/virulence factor BrkB family protein [Corynebacterium frankenforstense]|uniref:YihY/virulence factor BrkB family protein n=1 Tax=Corynebacterium frankenforstense TaxID=1230998 RepID=UPI0026EC3D60|nr:YihY/virulence factor BrkB family protein [Corynebacterium frankenforstense]